MTPQMILRQIRPLTPVFAAGLALAASLPVHGTSKDWNSMVDGFWNLGTNWTPTGVPASADDVTLGNVFGTGGARTTLDVNGNVSSLNIVNGSELSTAAFECLVTGPATLTGSGTTLLVKENNGGVGDSFDADTLDANTGTAIKMLGGRLKIDGDSGDGRLDVGSGATLSGFGFIDLEAFGAYVKLQSNGALSAGYVSDGLVFITNDSPKTLEIYATDPVATLNLDGVGSSISLLPAGTLHFRDMALASEADAYGSAITMSRKSVLNSDDPWWFDGTLNVNTGSGTIFAQTAGPATITGDEVNQTGGSIVLDAATDHLIFDTELSSSGGIINHDAGTLQFDGGATIGPSVDFQVGNAAELIVNSEVRIEDADWDWDGDEGLDNIITINGPESSLSAFIIDPSADQTWSGLMNINRGELWVQADNDDWATDGTIVVGGTGQSYISGDRMFCSGSLRVEAGAVLRIDTDAVTAGDSGKVFSGGTIQVDGALYLRGGDFTEWAGSTVIGSGVITPGTSLVSADQTIGVSVYDWDSGPTTIDSGVSLTLNVTNIGIGSDLFIDNAITVNSGILDVTVGDGVWELGDGGVLNLKNTGAGGATLAEGSKLEVLSAGKVNVSGTGNLLDTDVVFHEGSLLEILNGGDVTFGHNDDVITLAGGDISQNVEGATVTNEGSLIVTGESSVAVTTFDWDSGPTVIESTGNLTIDVTAIDDYAPTNQYDETLTINGGALDVSNADDVWIANHVITYDGGGRITGAAVQFGDDTGTKVELNALGSGIAKLSAPATFLSDTIVSIGAGATLRTGSTVFEPVNGTNNGEFTGTGTWQLAGTNTFNEATTINMTGGTVDLDNSAVLALGTSPTYDTDINALVYINAATLEDYGVRRGSNLPGSPYHYADLNIAGAGLLTVNLDDPNAEWTVNKFGIVNYDGDAVARTFLAGSDLRMNGILNVDGDGVCGARLEIGGTVNMNGAALPASEGLRLGGGNSSSNPNRLDGGTIQGTAPLWMEWNCGLHGHGTISSDIVFGTSSALRADDGILIVSGALSGGSGTGTLGTADDDGILNISGSWNTNQVDLVDLKGGQITGAAMTNDQTGGIQGFGEISSEIVNNTKISAQGGTLRLTSGNSDWDGASETGQLNAVLGNLEVVDSGVFPYSGTVRIGNGHELFVNGFNLIVDASATCVLTGGTLRSNHSQTIQGAITVNTILSALDTDSLIESTAVVTLNNNLHLAGNTNVQSGATITGSGALINGSGATLTLPDGYNLTVPLDNGGRLALGDSPGQVNATDFTQSASGTLEIEIAGTNSTDFDSLGPLSSAQLGGTLDLSLLGGFTPSLGQTFTIMTFLSRTGEFAIVNQPPTMPAGLEFDVIYSPTTVQLEVVGVSASFSDWIDSFTSLTDPADKTKTADPDNDGMNNLTEFALDDDPTTSGASGKYVGKIAPVGGVDAFTLTFPVRAGAVQTGPVGGEVTLEQTTDGVEYTVQASDDLIAFAVTVTEVVGADAVAIKAGLPALSSADWEYRSFRSAGPVAGDPREFMRVLISE